MTAGAATEVSSEPTSQRGTTTTSSDNGDGGAMGGRAPVPEETELVFEPKTLREALNSPQAEKWDDAVKCEGQSLDKMGTWEVIPPEEHEGYYL